MKTFNQFIYRLATLNDLPELRALMDLSIRQLVSNFLSAEKVEASFELMGLDTKLITDGTYFAIEADQKIIGCGGWSRRATLFGGDHTGGRDARLLDPATESARVRAMYTHPDYARKGVGRLLLRLCEQAARQEGFSSLELMSTTAGEPLYCVAGFQVVERVEVSTSTGIAIPLTRMNKPIPEPEQI